MWNNADAETKYRLQQEHEKNKIITAFEKEEYAKMYGNVEKKRRQRRKKREMEPHNYYYRAEQM
jgi:hypothetical protein